MSDLLITSCICLVLFSLIAVFDGVYFHLIKYQLHLKVETSMEHRIHMIRSLVFSILGLMLFVVNSAGILLYLAIIFVLIDLFLEVFDILVEKDARKNLGGIDSVESVFHVMASGLKFSSIVLVLLTKPLEAYIVTTSPVLPSSLPSYMVLTGSIFSICCLLGFLGTLISQNIYLAKFKLNPAK